MHSTSLPVPWRATPHVMTDRAFWDGVAKRADSTPWLCDLLAHAEQAPAKPVLPHASDFLAAKRSNDRARVDNCWQETRSTLAALAIRRAILGLDPSDPDDRLLDWFWAFLTQPTWVVSAHLPGFDLPASGTPQLDLAACEMAAFMAELLEVLRPWVDSVSDTLAASVIAEIDRRVVGPFAEGAEVWWHPLGPLTRMMNNWSGVCGGSILAACESLAAQGQPRPAARQRAIDALNLFFAEAFTPDGECDEGIGYWGYGIALAVAGLSRLSTDEFTQRFDLCRIARVADYPRRVHLFGDTFFSGNDAGNHARCGVTYVPWLGAATRNPWLLHWARAAPDVETRRFPMLLRLLGTPPALLEPAAEPLPATREPAALVADQQAAILRAPAPRGEVLAILAGGTNAERHNHNDLGHFTIAVAEELILPDIGNIKYTPEFFGPKRYTYVAASSRGHNCPIVNGQEQRPGKEAVGELLEWSPDAGVLSLELSAAYPAEAKLSRWIRTIRREQGGFRLIDEFQTSEPGVEVLHVMWSPHAPQTNGAALAFGPLKAALSAAPASVVVNPEDPNQLRLREFTDQTLHRVEARYATDAAGKLRVETTFTAP